MRSKNCHSWILMSYNCDVKIFHVRKERRENVRKTSEPRNHRISVVRPNSESTSPKRGALRASFNFDRGG